MSTRELTRAGLAQWADAGAHWQVVAWAPQAVVVEFCACTGEPVQRLTSTDPALVAYLREIRGDDQLPAPSP